MDPLKSSQLYVVPYKAHHVSDEAESFIQIATWLEPRDLLNLSRSCKMFREFLMSKSQSSLKIWQASFRNLGAPECPKDLNEPQYAELLFGVTCNVRRRLRSCQNRIP